MNCETGAGNLQKYASNFPRNGRYVCNSTFLIQKERRSFPLMHTSSVYTYFLSARKYLNESNGHHASSIFLVLGRSK